MKITGILILFFLLMGCSSSKTPAPPDPPSESSLYLYDGTNLIGRIVDGQTARLSNGEPLWIVSEQYYYASIAIDSTNQIGYTLHAGSVYDNKDTGNGYDGILKEDFMTDSSFSNDFSYPLEDLKSLLAISDTPPLIIKISYNMNNNSPTPNTYAGFYLISSTDEESISVIQSISNIKDHFVNSSQVFSNYNALDETDSLVRITPLDSNVIVSKYGFPASITASSLEVKDSTGASVGTWPSS